MVLHDASPLHMAAPTAAAWTTVNISEALPGVPTPLSWTFFEGALEYCFRAAFADFGVLSRSERAPGSSMDQRCAAIFYGRPALNLDLFRAVADRTPGSSGDAVEEQMFGSVQTADRPHESRPGRIPVIAVKAPLMLARLPALIRESGANSEAWWGCSVLSPPASPIDARALLAEAAARMKQAFRLQLVASFVAQNLFDQLKNLVDRWGDDALLTRLSTGYSSLAELGMLADMWAVSRGVHDISWFLERHGYHGPLEGELSSLTWREEPRELTAILTAFSQRGQESDPMATLRQRVASRAEAERELMARVPPRSRLQARLLLRLARTYIPFREDGKAAFLRVVDVARTAARSLGGDAARRGVTDEVDDIFYLTLDEVLGEDAAQPWASVVERRAQRETYRLLSLPDVWVGKPEVATDPRTDESDQAVTGLSVTHGVVEGIARVIKDDTARDDFEPGEILICQTTDPSWAPLFYLAAGIAIDVGGPMSHGAIVARELGIPCIINTRNGTSAVNDGDLVRLDASEGHLVVLQRSGANHNGRTPR